MAISYLKNLFGCPELASNSQFSQVSVAAGCKQSACGRAVYRVTYPVRQLVSSLLMIPVGWTLGAASSTWTALENRQCSPVVKLALSITSGVCALVASLTIGIAVAATVGLVVSVGKAICEPGIRIDELDTVFERSVGLGIINAREVTRGMTRNVP